MPIAVLSSVAAATVLYVLTNISYFSVLTADELLASDAVAIVGVGSMLFGEEY